MVEIIASALTTFLITVLVCIMMKAKEPDTASETHVEFTFHRTYKIIMLLCAIEGASMTLGIFVMGMVTRVSEEDLVTFLLTVLLFFTLTVLCAAMYLFFRNKKAVYEDGTFRFSDFWGREQTFCVHEIAEAVERQADGMRLTLDDGRKFKLDVQMRNYAKLKHILERSGISWRDQWGNVAPKGW